MLAIAAVLLALVPASAPSAGANPKVMSWQEDEVPDPCGYVIARAWVDPSFGQDLPILAPNGGLPTSPSTQINNPNQPFRTLQAAIDAVFIAQGLLWQANQHTEGIVYALPGIYGPTGSGDVFPIVIRDRVNVQGLGAQACVLREVSVNNTPSLPTSPPLSSLYLPLDPNGIFPPGFNVNGVVLVDFGSSSPEAAFILPNTPIPWSAEPDSSELFDGFTLQGGDVQMLFWIQPGSGFTAKPIHTRVTNCIFDMRHDFFPQVSVRIDGPFIAIEMAKHFTPLTSPAVAGYPEQYVMIAQNTFVMAGRSFATGSGADAWTRCRDGSVGIIDVTDSACLFQIADCKAKLRGVGSPGIFNNLFRTAPVDGSPTLKPMAMVGIDSTDTSMLDSASSTVRESNAFDSSRSGITSGWFASTPTVTVYQGSGANLDLFDCGPFTCQQGSPCNATQLPPNCASANLPVPALAIWDGSTGLDPCFVGEYLNDTNQVPPLAGIRYYDWRLLPGSPAVNGGALPSPATLTGGPTWSTAVGGVSWTEPLCALLRSSDWDCEEYGNRRIVDSIPDFGADEAHAYVSAGSYGNGSKSHNNPALGLSPQAPQGRSQRYLILRQLASLQNVVINGKATLPPIPTPPNSPNPPAWTQPPGTLTPAITGPAGLPRDSNKQWITFGNPTTPPDPTPTPWHQGVIPTTQAYLPAWMAGSGQANIQFCNLPQTDDELVVAPPVAPAGFGTYFATQLVMFTTAGAQFYWSNLQAEYR